ncbi:uncharacterized protein I206_102879 [Kwoniella pini CBS 10737]|uniref:Uncharacterized protein n=1 Tax=Kwoniella pini CBS 10737 TaxID=1296096 RepID=A0A1B9I6L8_9TREE|nr:uncharacterized protein I206_03229 [Kwoniella pini CBS 10737]OCF51163.1 hypothetical protein I206_03229 [Kwoniella pini CBS 10737]
MIDSLNRTASIDNSTLASSSQDYRVSLIEIILADTPFLALGFLSLTVITFYSTFNRSNNRILLLESSALTACFASLFNIVGMFYHNDQVAATTFQNIQESELRRFILTMLTIKQILLAISSSTTLLYFHISLEDHRKNQINVNTDRSVINTIEVERPKIFATTMIENNQIRCNPFERNESRRNIGKLARSFLVFIIFCSFIFELTWRIGFLVNVTKSNTFRHVYLTDFALRLLLYLAFSSCPTYHILVTSPSFRMEVFRQYAGIIGGIILGLVVVIGSLASLGFSERVVGRFFQGVQLYVLITSQIISDFNEHVPQAKGRIAGFSLIDPNRANHTQFEGLSTPTASTFRVSPPSISTPSPPPVPPGKRVSFHPAVILRRANSTGATRRNDTSSKRYSTSISSRIRTWVMSSNFHDVDLGKDEEKSLTSRYDFQTQMNSPNSKSDISTYENDRKILKNGPAPTMSSNVLPPSQEDQYNLYDQMPTSPDVARRSSQTIFNNLSRYSQNSLNNLIGIRRTISSPGARLLIFGQDSRAQVKNIPNRQSKVSSGKSSRQSSEIFEIPSNFPKPPEREIGLSNRYLEIKEQIEDLKLPIRPFVQPLKVGHRRMRSDLTHINVTSFIEGDSFKHGNSSSMIRPPNSSKENGRKTYQSDLSQITSIQSSEASNEIYLPKPSYLQSSPIESGSEDLTPTCSIVDIDEAKITKAIRSNSQPLSQSFHHGDHHEMSTISKRKVKENQIEHVKFSSNKLKEDLPMPESPTLPTSATDLQRINPQPRVIRSITNGSERSRSKYGTTNMI